MGMTERLLAAWHDAATAMDRAVEGTPEWERAKLAADNASMAYHLHAASFLDDVSGHSFEEPSASDQDASDEAPGR